MHLTEKNGVNAERIGIFGGSFNPPTIAHKALADFVFDALSLDRLLWVVAPHNPEKDPSTLADFSHRYQMVDKYLHDRPNMQPSDIEQINNSSWTIDTVRSLREIYPDQALVFIIGTDNWLGFHQWGRDHEQILDNVSIVVLERPGYESAKHAQAGENFKHLHVESPSDLKPFGSWSILQNPQYDMAATQVRQALQQGKAPPHIADEIYDYIKENQIYKKSST